MLAWPEDATEWVRALAFLPIVLCSIVGFALTLAKWRQTRRTAPSSDHRLAEFLVRIGERDDARALALDTPGASLAVRFGAAVVRQSRGGITSLSDRMELVGRQIVRELEHGLGGLALIATLGPLFGLLGTVIGIILIFGRLTSTSGVTSPQQLAGGIGTALHTTVAGLLVGVLALVSHRIIAARADRIAADLEEISVDLTDALSERPS